MFFYNYLLEKALTMQYIIIYFLANFIARKDKPDYKIYFIYFYFLYYKMHHTKKNIYFVMYEMNLRKKKVGVVLALYCQDNK